VDKAILVNADFLAQIVSEPEIFGHDLGEEEEEEEEEEGKGNSDSPKFPLSHESGASFCYLLCCPFSDLWIGTSHSHSHSHLQWDNDHQRHHGQHEGGPNLRKKYRPTEFDMDKLRSTLKQLVRDWSEEVSPDGTVYFPLHSCDTSSFQGKEERETCYKPMKDALEQHFVNISPEARSILLPARPPASPRIYSPFTQA